MNKLPPNTPHTPNPSSTEGSMRIGPFWKRAGESSPSALSPAGDEPFDALTDLFLGEVTGSRLPAASKPARAETPRAGSPRSAPTTPAPAKPGDGPTLRLAGGDDDDEYRLAPAPLPGHAHDAIQTRPAAPVLTLDDETCEAAPVIGLIPPPIRHPVLELLVLGNLPVLAGAWASQYVREIAEAAGKPVAYLRMQGEFASLEVVGALADVAHAPRLEDLGSLDAAIDAAAEITDRWIVRCDAGQESPVIAASITRAVTVLTGADQTAREACKQTLAALAPRLPAADAGPMVRLAIMGAADSAGAAAADLAALATTTLARPVAAIACAGRIGGVRPPHPLFSGATEYTLETILHSVQRALVADQIGHEPFPAPTAKPVAAVPSPMDETIAEVQVPAAPLPSPIAAVSAPAAPADPIADADELASLAQTGDSVIVTTINDVPHSLPAPTVITAPTAPAEPLAPAAVAPTESREIRSVSKPIAQIADSLAAHLADLTSTAVRCPYASGIEIAIDSTGALHLLARTTSDRTDDAAIAALLVASSWTEMHAPLIAPSIGTRPLPVRPTLHLFTDRPKSSRRLLETSVRIHLLAEVAVGSEHTWYCTDLN